MKVCCLCLLTFFISLFAEGQTEDTWDTYLADYDGKPGTTVLNMSLANRAPIKDQSFVLITGVTFKDCDSEGFPSKKEFDNLYAVEDSVTAIVDNTTSNTHAGTFTHQCQRLNYFYIKDTAGLRKKLTNLYRTRYPSYVPYINIKVDAQWEAYLKFLYPNEITMEYMKNSKVVLQLSNAGDALDKPRQVDHWLYFKTAAARNSFVEYAKKNNFKVEGTNQVKEKPLAYQLQISRADKVDVHSISQVTIELNKEARKLGGEYDGWETFIVK